METNGLVEDQESSPRISAEQRTALLKRLPPVEDLAAGEPAAWVIAYPIFADLTTKAIRRNAELDPSDLQDVCQTVIIELSSHIRKHPPTDHIHLVRLVRSVARSRTIDLLRARSRNQRRVAYSLDSSANTALEIADEHDAISELETLEWLEGLKMHIEKHLSPEERSLLQKRYSGESVRRLAEAEGIPPSTLQGKLEKLNDKVQHLKQKYEATHG